MKGWTGYIAFTGSFGLAWTINYTIMQRELSRVEAGRQQDKVEMEAKHREGKVEAEAVRRKDRAEIFAYLLQVIGTQDHEPLKRRSC